MPYKSIFEKLKNYSSNPVDEYNKISKHIKSVDFYGFSFSSFLETAYLYCNAFRNVYPSLRELLEANCSTIRKFDTPAKEYYDSLSAPKKENLLDEFLTYCQVMLVLIFTFRANKLTMTGYNSYIDSNNSETDYCIKLISVSLKCFNYKYIKKEHSDDVEIVLDNPIAESVASVSPPSISSEILSFLGARDYKTKENSLNNFIDLLEPALKKYSEQSIVKKTREYVQLLRHPEIKKDEKQYSWFYKNKNKFLDEIFTLCLFVQQYDLSKKLVENFESRKVESEGKSS